MKSHTKQENGHITRLFTKDDGTMTRSQQRQQDNYSTQAAVALLSLSRNEKRNEEINYNEAANEIDLILRYGKRAIVEAQFILKNKDEDTHNNPFKRNIQVATAGSPNGDVHENNHVNNNRNGISNIELNKNNGNSTGNNDGRSVGNASSVGNDKVQNEDDARRVEGAKIHVRVVNERIVAYNMNKDSSSVDNSTKHDNDKGEAKHANGARENEQSKEDNDESNDTSEGSNDARRDSKSNHQNEYSKDHAFDKDSDDDSDSDSDGDDSDDDSNNDQYDNESSDDDSKTD